MSIRATASYGLQHTQTYVQRQYGSPHTQYTEQQIVNQLADLDDELIARSKKTEWEEKRSWDKMCPHGLF